MNRKALLLLSGTSLFVLGSIACGSKSSDAPAPVTGDDSNIIGGVDAKSASLNAVGAILYRDPTTQVLQPLCTATLIGTQTILTAKHCAVQYGTQAAADDAGPAQTTETRFIEAFKEMYFAVGYDTKAPTKMVQLDDVQLCNDFAGGWAGLGCDISTYHLKEAITDIKPLKVASVAIADSAIGTKLTAIGYGSQNEPETALGTRKAGALTLRATSGAPLRTLFPTLDAFSAAVTQAEGAAFVSNSGAALGQLYDQEMKAGSEIFVGAAEGDAQICHGDSGGPLLLKVDGELVVQGVASSLPFAGSRLSCQNGGIYELPSSAPAQALIKSSITDPCAGIPAAGRCEGDVTVRCTRADEGPRRVVKTDCTAILQRCAAPADPDGGAADPDAGPVVTEVACVD